LVALWLCASLTGCTQVDRSRDSEAKTKLIYFGFDDHSETPQYALQMATDWGNNPPCSHWRTTIKREHADYQVLFGDPRTMSGKYQIKQQIDGVWGVTIVDRRGEILYSGGQGVLYLAHGNPDGSGVNICKLTGEVH
jgi:hypothetical protein